jgi:hypothetical protein
MWTIGGVGPVLPWRQEGLAWEGSSLPWWWACWGVTPWWCSNRWAREEGWEAPRPAGPGNPRPRKTSWQISCRLFLLTRKTPGRRSSRRWDGPQDQKVYIDLNFYRQLRQQLGAPGDFAQAYVIAHEVGHHVQHQLGIEQKVTQMKQRLPAAQANQLSVRLELQADCLAGVWAHTTAKQRRTLEEGDIEEAMNAAARIGDDALQQQSSGRVRPDSFTHGTSQQRQRWFATGLKTGDINSCDTFNRREA